MPIAVAEKQVYARGIAIFLPRFPCVLGGVPDAWEYSTRASPPTHCFSSSFSFFFLRCVRSPWFVLQIVQRMYLVRTCADFFFVSCLKCRICFSYGYRVTFLFFPSVFVHSRVIGACLVTADCILATTSCENSNKQQQHQQLDCLFVACFFIVCSIGGVPDGVHVLCDGDYGP